MRKRHGLIILSALLFLAVLLLVSTAAALTIGDDYPMEWRRLPYQPYVTDTWKFVQRQCTSFVAWCLNSRNGVDFNAQYGNVWWGDAKTWVDSARRANIPVDHTPAIGSVYCKITGSKTGHVGWVIEVDGSWVRIQEYNHNKDGMYHTTRLNYANQDNIYFIHIQDINDLIITQYDNSLAGSWYIRSKAFTRRKEGFLSASGSSVSVANYAVNQRFTLNMVPVSMTENGYICVPEVNPGVILNAAASWVKEGCGVNLLRNSSNSTQWWMIEQSGPYFIIHNKNNPSKVLTAEGDALVLRSYTGGDNQLWEFLPGDQDPLAIREYEVCYYSQYQEKYSPEYNWEHNLVKVDRKSMFEEYIIEDVMPEMPGKYFMGWSRNYNATEPDPKYAPGATFNRNEPLTLYAVWKDGSEVAERSIVMALDVSGSMQGTPIKETRNAAMQFVRSTLGEKVEIGLVTFSSNAWIRASFGTDKSGLIDTINGLTSGGGTNMGDALLKAYMMVKSSDRRKSIVLMSDGYPETGMGPDKLVELAKEIKDSGVTIYTLGFYQALSNKAECQALMEQIASEGCHYEVDSAFNLRFFFSDVAERMTGTRYLFIRIACPVEVSVTLNGETLASSLNRRNLRASFGTLSLEESSEEDGEIKVLRLKEGKDYDIEIYGTDDGTMDYTVGIMDENGEYTDFRRMEDFPITSRTMIRSMVNTNLQTTLNVDWDGDGIEDTIYGLTQNAGTIGIGRKDLILAGILVVLTIGLIVFFRVRKPVKTVHKSTPKRTY